MAGAQHVQERPHAQAASNARPNKTSRPGRSLLAHCLLTAAGPAADKQTVAAAGRSSRAASRPASKWPLAARQAAISRQLLRPSGRLLSSAVNGQRHNVYYMYLIISSTGKALGRKKTFATASRWFWSFGSCSENCLRFLKIHRTRYFHSS